ncbi:MAG: 30S ribosomal protein S9 [Candidatus Staskawiczbacteria bacterium]|jgi:small subunit ribosomal protein S9
MADKKITKKVVTKKEEPIKAPVVDIVEEIKPVSTLFIKPEEEILDDMGDDDISKEIAQSIKDSAGKPDRYFEAIGRRKTAVARIRLFTKGDKEFIVNDQDYTKYFQTVEDRESAVASMKKMKCLDKFRITIVVKGGGHRAQAEAIRHGTARVLVDFNANFRKRLRKAGFLTRDPRMRERKKFGLRRARRAPQWAKR